MLIMIIDIKIMKLIMPAKLMLNPSILLDFITLIVELYLRLSAKAPYTGYQ